MQTTNFEKHVWAEIDLDALRANFRAVKERAGSLPLCAVVKADSYGHGAVQCSRVFAEEGAAWLAVSCLAEAMQLRRAGQTLPILILGHVEPEFAAALIEHHITAACYSLPQAKALSAAAVAAGGQVDIHLKADTGMGRIGFALRTDFDKAIAEMLEACALPGLHMTGLFQHVYKRAVSTLCPRLQDPEGRRAGAAAGPLRQLRRGHAPPGVAQG